MTSLLRPIALCFAALALPACAKPSDKSEAVAPRADGAAPASKAMPLFNGKDLAGWDCVLVDNSLKKEDVWSVKDGILVCKGQPLGYLHTTKDYLDFELSLEWRWAPGTEPTNSGVLLRIAAPPATFLPKCVEAQLQHQKAGDLYGFFGASITGDAARFKEIDSEKIGKFHAVARIKGAEKPPGEWNRYDIKVKGGEVELKINGELVNQASGLDPIAGPVGLQSEGSEIHFRNVTLTPL